MSSQVDIANRALTKLGQSRIVSFEDDTNQARLINSMYTAVRDSELRAHVWRFTIARASLAALSSTPAWGYAYEYQLPSDCLRLIEIQNFRVNSLNDYITEDDSLYTVEGNKILTDLNAPLNIRYVARQEDTNQYNSDFAEALACRLAVECCEALTNSAQQRQLAWTEYKDAIAIAKKSNSLELPARSVYDDSWMLSRL